MTEAAPQPYLDVWCLNVDHGDSIVLHYFDDHSDHFGVIDSNSRLNQEPAALSKLKQLGAEKLSFAALTHPHADHYLGLYSILEHYRGKVRDFYTFPLRLHLDSDLPKLSRAFRNLQARTDGERITRAIREFIQLLVEAKEHVGLDNWMTLDAPGSFAPEGFADVKFTVLAPPRKVKGEWFQKIESGDPTIVENPKQNELSLAFLVEYAGVRIALGGDAVYSNWMDYDRFTTQRTNEPLACTAAKLPHHGSREECRGPVLDQIYDNTFSCVAVVSANGRTHPHADTYQLLQERSILPYCTNLSILCGANVEEMVNVSECSPTMRRFLNANLEPGERSFRPCQGNICIRIHHDGQTEMIREFENPCPYRDDFPKIFP